MKGLENERGMRGSADSSREKNRHRRLRNLNLTATLFPSFRRPKDRMIECEAEPGGCGKSKIYGDYAGTNFILKFIDLVLSGEYT